MKYKITKYTSVFLCTFLLIAQAYGQNAPIFTSTPVTTGTENVAYTYTVKGTDADNDPLTITGTTLPAWLTIAQGESAAGKFGGLVTAPTGIAADAAGNIYVAEANTTKIYKITPDGTTTLWHNRQSTGATYSMTVEAGFLYISYYQGSQKITKIDLANPAGGEVDVLTGLSGVLSVAFKGGFMYASMWDANKLIKVSTALLPAAYNAGTMDLLSLTQPFGLTFKSNGDLYIARWSTRIISKYDGITLTDVITTGLNGSISDVEFDANGNLYASTYNGNGVFKYSPDLSSRTQVYSVTGAQTWGMSFTPGGTLVFGVSQQNSVFKLETGAILGGTPSHANVGVHPVVLNLSDGTNNVTQSFNITVVDPNPPTVSAYTPLNNASNISTSANLVLTYNEDIKKGTGNITIKKTSDNSIIEQIDVTSNLVSISNAVVTINPAADLPFAINMYVQVDATAIKDLSDNAYAGINTLTTWKFETQKADQTITFAPANAVTYGVADFDPGATSTNNTIPITFISSNTTVATIVAGKVHVLKPGTVNITASQASNTTYNAAINKVQALTINTKALSLSLNAIPAITKVYDNNTTANLVAANYTLLGIENNDDVSVTGTAAYDNKNAGTGKTVTVNSLVLAGTQKDNYTLSTNSASTTGAINKKPLTATADNKTRFQGVANPAFTINYSGFISGEDISSITTLPIANTSATLASTVGNYPITASGGIAANYSFNYIAGVLTVIPGAPTSISLAAVEIFENQASGTKAGVLSSTADDTNATFTYSLVSGAGDTDNSLFAINGAELRTAAALNYEQKSSYSILVRSTTQNGLSLDKQFTINLTDVNEAPTMAVIANQEFCYTNASSVNLTGITAGPESGQSITVSVNSDNPNLFNSLTTTALSGGAITLNYTFKPGASGTALITVTLKDNGGTANGGVDTYSRTFSVRVNPLPVVSISSNLGTEISLGKIVNLSASGGSSYTWATAAGIIGGQYSSTLTVKPLVTTTYTVTVSNGSGCTSTQSITLNVLNDYATIDGYNILSPNGDGKNDKFIIRNIDLYPTNTVTVYDRAGRVLFKTQSYKNDWDGTFNGSPLAQDTYFYIVDFGAGNPKVKGFISIVR